MATCKSNTMCDDPSYVPGSCSKSRRGQSKKEDAPDLECATPELSQGYRILQDIIGISKFFLEQPDHREKGMHDYYDVISKPIWFREIQQKFAKGEYSKISEFVKDVRCLLLNCYTYFGPHDVHTKRALKVERVLEKKISLLPTDLRTQCSLESTHGIEDTGMMKDAGGDVQSQLLQSVIGERSRREQERKLRLSEERNKEKEGKEHNLLLWEQERLFTGSNHKNMESMWELPVIGHFVALSLEQLNINSISMFELERIILMPQASKSLAIVMTTLLSTPLCRMKLHTKPPMPYKIWTRKLEFKVSGWYKIYIKSNKNPDTVFEKLGIEHQFWKIMGDWNPLKEYEFHELSFHQRVSLIKALCDYIMQNHKNLRDTIAEKRDKFGSCLGEDRLGAKFLYFPQFLDQDVRIYRQAFEPKSWVDRDMDHQAELLAESLKNVPAKCGKSDGSHVNRKHRRKSAWKRGKIVKQHKHSHLKSTKELLKSSCKSPRSESNQATENSVPDSAVCVDENCMNENDSRLLGNVNSSPHAGHSSYKNNENICGEKQNEHSNNTLCHINTNSETGELETSAILNLDSGSKGTNCKSESKDMELNSNQTTVSEEPCASSNESQFKKCSSEYDELVLCCHLKTKKECTDCDMNAEPSLDVTDKNDFIVKDYGCKNVEKVPLYQTKSVDQDKNSVLEVPKTRRPLYNPHWLVPNPDDFQLVADSVEGVRQLLTKYSVDDDSVLFKRFDKKSQKRSYSSCEVRFAHRLASLISDLDSLELKIVTNTKQAREKLYKECQDFENRSADYADPDEAFWLNEKEPAEIPETQASQNSEILEETELPQTQVTDPGGASEDQQQISASGMKLRYRRLEDPMTKEKLAELVTSEESTEDDSDESDIWVMPNNRKNMSAKRKKNDPALLHCSKKKHASEEQTQQQPPLKCDESSSNMVANSLTAISILDDQKPATKKHSTMTAAALRIKKRLFLQNEASSSEANRQLEWEKNRQKLVNSAANKAAAVQQPAVATSPTKIIIDNRNKIIVDNNGKITVTPTNNKALLTLQGRKIGDIIKEGKVVKKDGLITGVIGVEMEKGQSHISGVQNGQKANSMLHKTAETPVSTTSSGQVVQAHMKMKSLVETNSSQSLTSTVVLQDSVQTSRVMSASVQQPSSIGTDQRRKTVILTESHFVAQPVTQVKYDVICISDDSDNSDVEFVGTVYNPKLDYRREKKKVARPKCERCKLRVQDSSTSKQTDNAPKTVSHVQGETSRVKPVTSTCNSVTALPNQIQTGVSNPHTSTAQLVLNTTALQNKVERQYTANHVQLEMHTLSQNQDSRNETLQKQKKIQPDSNTRNVLRNCQSQTKSVQHIQGQNPRPSTVDTIMSPSPSSSTKNNQNIHIDNSVAALGTQKFNSISNIALDKVGIRSESQLIPSHIPLSQSPSHINPYVVTAETSPGAPVTHVRTSATSSNQTKGPADSFTHIIRPGIPLTKTRNPASKSSSLSQIPGSPSTPKRNPAPPLDQTRSIIRYPGAPVDQAKNPCSPVAQTSNHPLSPEVRSPGSALVQMGHPVSPLPNTKGVGTPVIQARVPGTPVAQRRIPGTPTAQTRSPGTPTGTPVAQARIPRTPVIQRKSPVNPTAQTNSPVAPVAQTRIPGTPGTYTRSYGTTVAKIKSPGNPVAQMSPGSIHFTQEKSPGTSLVQPRNSGSPLFQAQSHDTCAFPTGANLSHGRGNQSSGLERAPSDMQQQLNHTPARLVVIAGDENVSKYALVLPNGAKVILTPEQVADIRAANGGLLSTNLGI